MKLRRKTRRRLDYEDRLLVTTLLTGLPAVVAAAWMLYATPHATKVTATVTVAILGFWIGGALVVRHAVIGPLNTLGNLLLALREGDYSIRGRHLGDDALGLAVREVNQLGDRFRQLQLGRIELMALLDRVMSKIDVVIIAVDEKDGRVVLWNPAAKRLVPRIGYDETATSLGLSDIVGGPVPRIVDELGGARGQWELRQTVFRHDGRPVILCVLTDVRRVLRDEERQAWHRLVRVFGHEINNSLAPIRSIAESLQKQLARPARDDDGEDLRSGLEVIGRRADSLGRFLRAYAQVSGLPPPHVGYVAVDAWVRRVAALETRLQVDVRGGEQVTIKADGDQLDQLLINLVKNAVDAALPSGHVIVDWHVRDRRLELRVTDDGPGLAATANLFVPFFTTKAGGTGIGLTLSRQIAEAHGGSLTLTNRKDARGCEALLTLPID